MGKETVKGGISGGAGLGVSALVALIPGVGWVVVSGAGILGGILASWGVDWVDEKLQREGVISR